MMHQYMSDSCRTELYPRELILDPTMQARDTALIKNSQVRQAQELKQAHQSKEILEDLRNGVGIKQAITVFEVKGKNYVVDGFHRVGACLEYIKETGKEDLKINALLIKNRTHKEAFLAAQEANQSHGVGVTKDEVNQSKFRSLIVQSRFDLTVSEIEKTLACSRGQANHIGRALKACGKVLKGQLDDNTSISSIVEYLKEGLLNDYYLTDSCWDSQGFPKIRRLSDAVAGKDQYQVDMDNEEYEKFIIEDTSKKLKKLVEQIGEDYFREALRKVVRGTTIDVSISNRKKWLERQGAVSGDERPEDWDGTSLIEDEMYDF